MLICFIVVFDFLILEIYSLCAFTHVIDFLTTLSQLCYFHFFLLQQLCKQFLNSLLWENNGYVNRLKFLIRKHWFWPDSAKGRNPNQIKASLSEVEGNVQHTIDISVHLIWQIGEDYKKINSSFLNFLVPFDSLAGLFKWVFQSSCG